MEGKWTYYYPNGKKLSEGMCHGDAEVGTWTYWNDDGSVWKVQEHDERGMSRRITEYENGVVKRVVLPDNSGTSNCSGTHWDDDPKKRAEIEEAYQRKLRAGATHDQAREGVIQEYGLRKRSEK
jgi:antitoxin component YwqK of YwqJK toxin-antitoxin module